MKRCGSTKGEVEEDVRKKKNLGKERKLNRGKC